MEKYIRKLGRNSIIMSIILLVFGLFMFIKPISTINVLMMIFGILLVIDGLLHLVSYFSIKNEYRFFSSELAQAIIYIILGIWIIVDSIFKLQIALNIRDIYDSHWGILLAMSIINALLGAVILINPFESLALLTMCCGAILMIVELISIFESFSIISRVGEYQKIEKQIEKKVKKVKKEK